MQSNKNLLSAPVQWFSNVRAEKGANNPPASTASSQSMYSPSSGGLQSHEYAQKIFFRNEPEAQCGIKSTNKLDAPDIPNLIKNQTELLYEVGSNIPVLLSKRDTF